jgi:hypothetical protein
MEIIWILRICLHKKMSTFERDRQSPIIAACRSINESTFRAKWVGSSHHKFVVGQKSGCRTVTATYRGSGSESQTNFFPSKVSADLPAGEIRTPLTRICAFHYLHFVILDTHMLHEQQLWLPLVRLRI